VPGSTFGGIVVSDRFSAYNHRPLMLKISGGLELICRRVKICPRPLYLDVRSLSTPA
jgi:hypothetical protein